MGNPTTVLRPSTVIVSPTKIDSNIKSTLEEKRVPEVICKSLKDSAINADKVSKLDLSNSDDLVCKNIMCEKLGDPCVCKLARFLAQTQFPKLEGLSLDSNKLTTIPDPVFQIKTLKSLSLNNNKVVIDQQFVEKLKLLPNLEKLSFKGNTIKDDANFGELKSLKEVEVDEGAKIKLGNYYE